MEISDENPRLAEALEIQKRVQDDAPRLNCEIRFDGTEDPIAASYVEGYRDAWSVVDARVRELLKELKE